ncbi:alpha/beta hydrolase [Streptomyces inhibens]|uniref:alpha/beta hydrolase n=1 Tax=Streptomyces inhibens TaxID=2293571 RepID=UPI001EE76733|nr:alpha/beta hydrolase [Streptomyces inhibens]UKY50309.1 alpha/beta hydrolase family protein [Streptomyces inhibens]
MVTMRELQNYKSEPSQRAGEEWGVMMSRCSNYMDWVDTVIRRPLQGSWKGRDADAAQDRLGRLGQNFQYAAQQTSLIRTALDGVATALAAERRKLIEALEEAESRKYTVHDDGTVEYTAEGTDDPHAGGNTGPDPNIHWAQEIQDHITQAVKRATEIDQEYASTLNRLQTGRGLTIDDRMWLDAARDSKAVRKAAGDDLGLDSIPKKGTKPKDVNSWWRGLSHEEQQEYQALYPGQIGALDGIPSDVRDEANRGRLRQSHADAQMKLNQHLQEEPDKWIAIDASVRKPNPEWEEWDEKRKSLQGLSDGTNAIQSNLDKGGEKGLPEGYLLGFDDEGIGRAIVARGNPDTADHTAVYVPGTKTNLPTIGGDLDRSDALWRESSRLSDGQSVSTVTWLGYEAPQEISGDAMESEKANEGGPLLNQFVDGTRATHDGDSPSHTTLVGHSYGSVVIGSAARQGDVHADDIVVAGSPGMQVSRASELDVDKGHVWNETGTDDWVPEGGSLTPHAPREWRWWGEYDAVTPDSDLFGANQMETDTSGHGDYWNYNDEAQTDPSESLRNQARVIVGDYDKVSRDD